MARARNLPSRTQNEKIMKLIRCPKCQKILAPSFPIHDCSPHKHGFEIRFSKTVRPLKVLSYAIYKHGFAIVDHETTRANRKAGSDLKAHLKIERAHYPDLKVLNS